jgi:hypothetical protein
MTQGGENIGQATFMEMALAALLGPPVRRSSNRQDRSVWPLLDRLEVRHLWDGVYCDFNPDPKQEDNLI